MGQSGQPVALMRQSAEVRILLLLYQKIYKPIIIIIIMKLKQKLIKVGNNSLMIIIPAKICEGNCWKAGDSIEVILKGGTEK